MYFTHKKTSKTAQIDPELAHLPSAGHRIPSVLLSLSPTPFFPGGIIIAPICHVRYSPAIPLWRMGVGGFGWLAGIIIGQGRGEDGEEGAEGIKFCQRLNINLQWWRAGGKNMGLFRIFLDILGLDGARVS